MGYKHFYCYRFSGEPFFNNRAKSFSLVQIIGVYADPACTKRQPIKISRLSDQLKLATNSNRVELETSSLYSLILL